MSSIISKMTLEKMENARKYVLKAAIWVLVGAVILGVLMILLADTPNGEVIGKFMGTLFIVAFMMVVSVDNFKRIASEVPSVQIFALVGLFSNVLWAILWTLLIWNPEWMTREVACPERMYATCKESTMLFKFASAFSYLSFLGLIGSNVMAIYEGSKKDLIRPLKITAVVCATYEMLYFTVMAFVGYEHMFDSKNKMGMLAGFVGVAWFMLVIAVLVLSRNERKRDEASQKISQTAEEIKPAEQVAPVRKSEEELRAEIEEQVKREMIEKEVRARMEAEMGKKEGEQ